MTDLGPVQAEVRQRPTRGGYMTFVSASCGRTFQDMVRQQRLILAAAVVYLPVLLPLAVAFLSRSKYGQSGLEIFSRMSEELYINALAPLLALFFATMLVGEDAERQTISYMLTRPTPRSAWVLGRLIAYFAVSLAIVTSSMLLTFAGCTSMEELSFSAGDLKLFFHYTGVASMALVGYGVLTMFLGATTKRPIILGVMFIYPWQALCVRFVPGLLDFLTIQKYTNAMMPVMAESTENERMQAALEEFHKEQFLIDASASLVTLILISVALFALTVGMVRWRQFSSSHAIGG